MPRATGSRVSPSPETPAAQRLRVAVLLSGRGSNLGALIAARDAGALPIDLVLAASDKPAAPGLALARAAGVPVYASDPRRFGKRSEFEADLFEQVRAVDAELVVLAGFMRILSARTVGAWHGRMINIHPSLLPRHPGLGTHDKVLAAGETEHGASVHFVTPELDGGPVIAQVRMPVRKSDTPERLARRLLPLEHQLLVSVVGLLSANRVRLEKDSVLFDGELLTAPLLIEVPRSARRRPTPR
jgi:phosphoribosylglycinamide formyltransferase 1